MHTPSEYLPSEYLPPEQPPGPGPSDLPSASGDLRPREDPAAPREATPDSTASPAVPTLLRYL